MQTNNYIFLPETSGIWTWVLIAGIGAVGLLFLMYRVSGIKVGNVKTKSQPLLFLLAGLFFLIAVTIFSFSIFNLTQSQPCVISDGMITKGKQKMTLTSIRKSMVHREGSGVPFQGVGVERGTDNSLIVVDSAGRSIIFSEDIYPIDSIQMAIQQVKKKK